MNDTGKIRSMEPLRLRDGRAVVTEEDQAQWLYEFFDAISQDLGQDYVPSQVFPAIVRVMCEWVMATNGLSPETDLDNARALADAVSALTSCLSKCSGG